MATLTEKESVIQLGDFVAKFYAEYSDGKCKDVYMSIEVRDYPIIFSPFAKCGQHLVWSAPKGSTDVLLRIFCALADDFGNAIADELTKLTNEV